MTGWLRRSLVLDLLVVARLFAVTLFAVTLFARTASGAEDPAEQARRSDRISNTFMSPFCPGRTLADCPRAGQWREDIRQWVEQGLTTEQIREKLQARAPDFNLSGSPQTTTGRVMPFIVGLLSIGLLVLAVRAFLRRPAQDAQPAKAPGGESSELDARLDKELEELDT